MRILLSILLGILCAVPAAAAEKQAADAKKAETHAIHVITVADAIGPAVAEYVVDAIHTANEASSACIIIELDTPGGLVDSMRSIVQAIFDSRAPVVVFVAPSGARAASAGVMITLAADIAAMAPGTNIGAAHPVGAGGNDVGETMQEKITNDMVAYIRSIAQKRGRNPDWAEDAVRESISTTETDALKMNVIDLIARDRNDLIDKLNGRKVRDKGALELNPNHVVQLKEGLRTKILRVISNPNVAYLLMMIGLAGLYFELSHPGTIFPGVIGGVCLILAFFAFQTLPVNFAGILLIALALILFILEIKVTSYGLLSIGGVITLLLGSLMLFKENGSRLGLAWSVILPTLGLISAFFVAVAGLAFRAQVSRPRTGIEALVGEIGVVRQSVSPFGKVFVHGELWRAHADVSIPVGSQVRVTSVHNLVLEVESLKEKAS
jgi:membrane-bound serine protease (ClpP class)